MYYPLFYYELCEQREDILESYHSTLADTGRRGTGGHSDPTANKAERLSGLGKSGRLLALVPGYMGTLSPLERELILSIWSCGRYPSWKYSAKHCRLTQYQARQMWEGIVAAFQVYVGAANAPAGTAYADGRPSQCRG